MQVNYLGHWLLAHELLGQQRSRRQRQCLHPQNMRTAKGAARNGDSEAHAAGMRVIFLSSTTHRAGRLDFADLQLARRGAYSGFGGYANSKLAALLAARELPAPHQQVASDCGASLVWPWECTHMHGHGMPVPGPRIMRAFPPAL